MSISEFERLSRNIDGQTTEVIQLMKNLVAIKSVGPLNNGPGELEKAQFLKQYLKTFGFTEIEEYFSPDSTVAEGMRPNLIATIPGKNRDRKIWIMSHMDVVPAGDLSKWETDPFETVVKDGKIFGRGTEDNGQGIVSSIIAAKAFIEEGLVPKYDIALLFVSDEETGNEHGLTYMLENHSELFAEDDFYIVPDAGEADGSMIEVAEKSLMWVKFKTVGKQAHASLPESGINAFRAGSQLVVELNNLHQIFNEKNSVFDPPISTFEPTKKESNELNINTIPGEDVFYLDCRVLPRYDLDDILTEIKQICAAIERRFKVTIEATVELREQSAPATDVDAEVVKTLSKAIKQVYKIVPRPMGIGGGTVATNFRKKDLNVAVWATIADTAHQPNEYAVLENILKDAKVFAHVALHP